MDRGSTGLLRSRLEARTTIDGSRDSEEKWERVAMVKVEDCAEKRLFGWEEGKG